MDGIFSSHADRYMKVSIVVLLLLISIAGIVIAESGIFQFNIWKPLYGNSVTIDADLTVNGTIQSKNVEEPYSYLIYTDGTLVYAKNGKTDRIAYRGTAQTVFSSVLAENPASILINEGNYTGLSSLAATRSLKIAGQGSREAYSGSAASGTNGRWRDFNTAGRTILKCAAPVDTLFDFTGNYIEGLEMSHFTIEGCKYAVLMDTGYSNKIHDMSFIYNTYGVYFADANIAGYSEAGEMKIENNRFVGLNSSTGEAIHIGAKQPDNYITNNIITEYNVGIKSLSAGNKITLNHIYLGAGKNAIDMPYENVTLNIITNNIIDTSKINVWGSGHKINENEFYQPKAGLVLNNVNSVEADNNIFYNTINAINITGASVSNQICGNIFEGNDNSVNAIAITFDMTGNMDTNIVCNNNFYKFHKGTNNYTAIRISGSGNWYKSQITGNTFRGRPTSKIIAFDISGASWIGGGQIIKDNIEVNAQNSAHTYQKGSASVSNGGNIAHELIRTPTSYWITPTAANVSAAVVLANATHLTVALYWLNGTAITSPVKIMWGAEI